MTKKLWLAFLVALLVVLASWAAVQAQDKSLYWQRYDVNLAVQPNSDILVEEIQQIQFTSGTFRFGFAAIPMDRLDDIIDISLSEVVDGQEIPYQPGSTGEYGFVTNYNGDTNEMEITWYFPPTSNTSHTYILRYRVVGGVRIYDGGDQIYWKAIAPDHNFPIQSSKVTVTLPAQFPQNQLQAESYGAPAEVSYTDQGQVVFEADNIPADQELEIRVQFPSGTVQAQAPEWQASYDRRQTWGPVFSVIFGGLGLIFLVGGPLLVYLLWYTRGRDRPTELVAEYITEPPSDLPAAIVGTLVDESADVKDIIAGLLDLANRGAIRMQEEKKEGFLGIGSGQDFVFTLIDSSKATRKYEQILLDDVFDGAKERQMSDLRQKFYAHISGLQNQLYQEVVEEGFFPRNPKTVRSIWTGLGFVGLVVAGLFACLLLLLLGDYSPWAACPGASLAMTMVALLIVGRAMPRKTPKGAEEAAKWLAFKRYLETIEKHGDLEVVKDKFGDFLPYAVAFGLERKVISQFEKVDTPAPSWWGPVFIPMGPHGGSVVGAPPSQAGGPPGPLAGEGGGVPSLSDMSQGMGSSLSSMSDGLGSMLSSASTVLTSTPPKSSGSGGSWGGGGWSGGGFGGGGGGGGGSRGFG